jgi:acyl carrier protein
MPTISSRTPEGNPGRCPVCRREVTIEDSQPFGDAPCPHCGTLLRFVNAQGELLLFDEAGESVVRARLRSWIAERLGVSEEQIGDEWEALQKLGVDSLDIVELVMDIEEDFDDPMAGEQRR